MSSNGPIQGYLQCFSQAAMGPFKAISSFSHEQQWAHLRLLAVYLMSGNGPIQGYGLFIS
jgi:hypothetical protein